MDSKLINALSAPKELGEQSDISTTVAALNRLVHEPARLAILTVLAACEASDFVFLRTTTGLTAGNLSVQLVRLEDARLIDVEKSIEKRRTLTMVRLTSEGSNELEAYWRSMERLRMQVREPIEERGRRQVGSNGLPSLA